MNPIAAKINRELEAIDHVNGLGQSYSESLTAKADPAALTAWIWIEGNVPAQHGSLASNGRAAALADAIRTGPEHPMMAGRWDRFASLLTTVSLQLEPTREAVAQRLGSGFHTPRQRSLEAMLPAND